MWARVPATVAVVTIAEGEADIFDLFVLPRREGSHILIRATHNHRVEMASMRHGWSIHVGIAAEGSTTSAHERAVCELNDSATLERSKPLKQQVILAEEDNPPTGHVLVKLAHVKLGKRCLHWSWLSHFVLKSGCRFTTGER